MIELDSKTPVIEKMDRIPVFSIDGKEYTMPGEVKAHIALRYLWFVKQDGPDYAAAWLMEQILGYDGFKALSEYEPLTQSQFEQIQTIIIEHTMGSVESGEGKDRYSGNGSKKSPGHKNTKKT